MPPKVSIEHRCWVVCQYGVVRNAAEVIRRYKKEFPDHPCPRDVTITKMFEKFIRTGSVQDDLAGNVGPPVTVRTPEMIKKVKDYYRREKQPSIRRCAAKLQIGYATVWAILHDDLHFKAYKVQLVQLLRPHDKERRLEFANTMLEKLAGNQIDLDKIWFSDEAHFYLHGYVNKQNHRIWGTENPHFVVEKPLHPEYLTVWMGISCAGIIGPFFFYSTITGESYQTLLEHEVMPELVRRGQISEFWWQQDGATPHRTQSVKTFIRSYFDDRIIGLGFETEEGNEITWPPYSPDLNPCDYWLWGSMKDAVYRVGPKNLHDLKTTIENYVKEISADTMNNVITNFKKRLELLKTGEGNHFENIL